MYIYNYLCIHICNVQWWHVIMRCLNQIGKKTGVQMGTTRSRGLRWNILEQMSCEGGGTDRNSRFSTRIWLQILKEPPKTLQEMLSYIDDIADALLFGNLWLKEIQNGWGHLWPDGWSTRWSDDSSHYEEKNSVEKTPCWTPNLFENIPRSKSKCSAPIFSRTTRVSWNFQ